MNKTIYHIVLVEFDKHWDSTDGFCRLIAGSGHQLTIITDEYIYDSIHNYPHNSDFTFHVKPAQIKRGDFIRSSHELFEQADIVFINTVHEKLYDFLSIQSAGIIILRVHNLYKHFRPLTHISIPFGLFYWRKAAGYVIREIILGNYLGNLKKLNKKIDYFTFLSQSITDHALLKKMVDPQKVMFSLPLLPWQEIRHRKPEEYISISIVGALEKRKKDYDVIVKAFRELFRSDAVFNKPVRLNLLGQSDNAYGKKIIAKLQQIKHPSFHLNSYRKNVPVAEFDRLLSETHIIISPIRVNNITQIYGEVYGLTKFSASIGTIMQFHAVGLFPAEFTFDHDFEQHFLKYNGVEALVAALRDLLNEPKLINDKMNQLEIFLREKYEKRKILKSFENVIENTKHEKDTIQDHIRG